MEKKTQKKTKENKKNNKRRKLGLAIGIPVGAVALGGAITGIVLGVKSCGQKLEVVYVTKDPNLGTYTVEGNVGETVTITFNPASGYMIDGTTVKVTVGETKLSLNGGFYIVGNSIVIRADAVKSNKITIAASAKLIPSVEEISGIVATGFKDQLKGKAYLKASDLTVVLTYNTGDTKVLDYTKGDYKVSLDRYYGREKTELGEVDITNYALSEVGTYGILIKWADNETITCNGVINVSVDKTVTVNYDKATKVLAPGAIISSTDKITIENNTISIKAKVTTDAVVGQFKVYATEDVTQDPIAESLTYVEIDSTEKTFTIPVNNWSRIQGDTVYVDWAQAPKVTVTYSEDKEQLGLFNEETSTVSVDPLNNTIKAIVSNNYDQTGSKPVWGVVQVWKVETDGLDITKKQLVCQTEAQQLPYEGKTADPVTFESTIPADFVWNFGKGESFYAEFVTTKTGTVGGMSSDIEIDAESRQIFDSSAAGARQIKFTAKADSEKEAYLYVSYEDDDGVQHQVSQLMKTTLTTTAQTFTIDVNDWSSVPENKVVEFKVYYVVGSDIPVSINSASLTTFGLTCDEYTQKITFTQPTITAKLEFATAPTKHFDLIARNENNVEVGRVKNVDLSAATSPTSIDIEVTNFASIGTSVTIYAEETVKQITFTVDESVTKYFDVSFQDNNPVVTKTSEKFVKAIYYNNFDETFTVKGQFILRSVEQPTRAWGLTETVAPGKTYSTKLEKYWEATGEQDYSFGYDEHIKLMFKPDETFEQCYVTPVTYHPEGVIWTQTPTLLSSTETTFECKVKNTASVQKTFCIAIDIPCIATWWLEWSTKIPAEEEKTVTITIPTGMWDKVNHKGGIILRLCN